MCIAKFQTQMIFPPFQRQSINRSLFGVLWIETIIIYLIIFYRFSDDEFLFM